MVTIYFFFWYSFNKNLAKSIMQSQNNLIYKTNMQNYEQFWSEDLTTTTHNELLLDWDIFIHNFTKAILRHSHYELNSTQQQYIKTLIDPRQSNQIYKNAFLLFSRDYWDVASNRNRLFKMKINLSGLPRLKLMTGHSPQRIYVQLSLASGSGLGVKKERFQLREDRLYGLDGEGFQVSDRGVRENGFLAIGSAEENDIQVDECMYVNRNHLKLVSVKREKKGKKKSIFDEKEPEPQIYTEWYLRDTSKSCRLKYLLDNQYKYMIVKPNLVLSLGMTDDTELVVEKIGFSSGNITFSAIDYEQMTSLLNADRINYLGEIDKSVPLKSVVDLDFREISAKEVEELFEDQQYYPEFKDEGVAKGKKDKEVPSVTFCIRNKVTLEEKRYTANDTNFTVGRSKQCKFRIEGVSIRKKEVIFQRLNSFWTVRAAQPSPKPSILINIPSVYLASRQNMAQNRNSNRVRLREGYSYLLRGKSCQFDVNLEQPEQKEEQY